MIDCCSTFDNIEHLRQWIAIVVVTILLLILIIKSPLTAVLKTMQY